MSQSTSFEPDGCWDDWHVSVVASNNLRDLRGQLLAAAYRLKADADARIQVLCLLADSKITPARIEAELDLLRNVLLPDLASRIHLGRWNRDGRTAGVPELGNGFRDWLADLVRKQTGHGSAGGSRHAVLGHLVLSWLRQEGPLATSAIQTAVGASYPTVAQVLKRLEALGVLQRISDRRVELKRFPWDEWGRWIVAGRDLRKTVVFVDPSGRGRTPQEMARRLAKLERDDVGVGGVLGAKHYFPKLDINGSVRLDLSVAGHSKAVDLGFIRKLDAGLVRSDDPNQTGAVAVHFLGKRVPGFERGQDGMLWADPLECLSDLYELRLDGQAQEMLHRLVDRSRRQDLQDDSWHTQS